MRKPQRPGQRSEASREVFVGFLVREKDVCVFYLQLLVGVCWFLLLFFLVLGFRRIFLLGEKTCLFRDFNVVGFFVYWFPFVGFFCLFFY